MKVNIETTNLCNAKCICCPNKNMTRPRGYIDLTLLQKIMGQLPDKVEELCLSMFGEPLMDTRLPDILGIVRKSYKGKLLFFTNGILMGSWVNKAIYDHLNEIIISFNGWNEKSYYKNMKLNFYKAKAKIKEFIAGAPA